MLLQDIALKLFKQIDLDFSNKLPAAIIRGNLMSSFDDMSKTSGGNNRHGENISSGIKIAALSYLDKLQGGYGAFNMVTAYCYNGTFYAMNSKNQTPNLPHRKLTERELSNASMGICYPTGEPYSEFTRVVVY